MDTVYLEEFLVLRNKGNYVQAADELGISQSALSRHVQALEKEIGSPLIRRNSHSFQLTRTGIAFCTYALTVLEAQKNFTEDIGESSFSEEDTIRFGFVHGADHYQISDLLIRFHETEPDIRFQVYCAPGSELVHQLHQNETDIIMVWDLDSPSLGQRSLIYKEDSYVLHIPKGHRLYGREYIHLSQLEDEQIIIRVPKYSRTLLYINQQCQNIGFDVNLVPKPGYWISSADNNLYLSLKGQIGRIQHSQDYSIANINPPITQRLSIKYRTNDHSAATEAFIRFLIKEL